jgi:hypothetical protein
MGLILARLATSAIAICHLSFVICHLYSPYSLLPTPYSLLPTPFWDNEASDRVENHRI